MKLINMVFKIIYFIVCQVLRHWPGIRLKELFVNEGEVLHRSNLLGVKSSARNVKVNSNEWNSILRDRNVPLRVKYGVLDHVELSFGWFLSGKISLKICGLYLLMHTTNERIYNREREIQKALQLKRLLVKKFEQLERKTNNKNVGAFQRFCIRLLLYFIRKIEITCQEAHIRIEDNISLVNMKTSTGLSLKHISVKEDDELQGSELHEQGFAKKLDIQDICYYWNPNETQLLSELSEEYALDKISVSHSVLKIGYSYVLKPSCIIATAVMSRGKLAVIELNTSIYLKGIDLLLSKEQIKVITHCLGYFKHLQNTLVFIEYRPPVPILRNAKQWWWYAMKCIRFHLRRSKWDWLDVKEQRELRKNYAEYYKKLLIKGSSWRLRRKLQSFEDEMSLLNILLVRKKIKEELQGTLQATKRHVSKFSWFRRRNVQKIQTPISDKRQMIYYSLSGHCSITDIQLTLADLKEDLKTDLFTLQLSKSHISITKQDHMTNYEVTLGNLQCVGVAETDQSIRPNLFLRAEPTETLPVLSFVCTSNNRFLKKTIQRYDHSIQCQLRPSAIILDWITIKCLADIVGLLTTTHQDLKDALKEQVKEVGRESQIKLRHFIDNKELASVTADLYLPLIVLQDTIGASQHTVLCLGHLTVDTTQDMSTSIDSNVCQRYNSIIKGAKILFHHSMCFDSSQDCMFYFEDIKNDNVLIRICTLHGLLMYTTFTSTSVPSKLTMDMCSPEVYMSLSDERCEKILVFLYHQLSSLLDAVAIATNQSIKSPKQIEDEMVAPVFDDSLLSASTFEPLVSTVYQDLKLYSVTHPPVFAHTVTELDLEETDNGTETTDHTIFSCDVNISKIVVHLKRQKEKWVQGFVTMELQEVGVVTELREQALLMTVKLSEVLVKNLHRFADDGHPVKLFSTSKDFLQIQYTYSNPKAPLFFPAYKGKENEHIINMRPFTLCLHRESLIDIISSITNISVPPFKSLSSTLIDDTTSNQRKLSLIERFFTTASTDTPTNGAVYILFCFSLEKFTVTVATENAHKVVKATINECHMTYVNRYVNGELKASIEKVDILDLLITDSPYKLVLSNVPDSKLFHAQLVWNSNEATKDCVLTGEALVGSTHAVYLHKMITTIKLFVMELLYYWNEMIEQVNIQLMSAIKPRKMSKKFPRQPQKIKKPKKSNLLYKVDVNFEQSSVLVPMGSYNTDALRVTIEQMSVVCRNKSYVNTSDPLSPIIEEPDTGLLMEGPDTGTLMEGPDTGTLTEVSDTGLSLRESHGAVEAFVGTTVIDWMFSNNKKTVFKAFKTSLSRSACHSSTSLLSWKLIIPNIEVFCTPERLVTLPAILNNNFTEPEPLGLPRKLPLTAKKQKTPGHTLKRQQTIHESTDTSLGSLEDVPLLEIMSEMCRWILYQEDNVVIATVDLKKTWVSFGLTPDLMVKGNIGDITGYQGMYNEDQYHLNQKLISRSNISSKHIVHRPLVNVVFCRKNDGEITVTGGLSHLSVCLWPNFVNSFVKYLKQCKSIYESRAIKKWKKGIFRRKSTIVKGITTPIKIPPRRPTVNPSTYQCKTETSQNTQKYERDVIETSKHANNRRFNIKIKLDKCIVAILEDPDPLEIITPGMFFEFHCFKSDSFHAAVCDIYATPTEYGINLSPCHLLARLCLYGETIIPLNQVIPPTSLEVHYISSKNFEKLTLTVPRFVINLTNELKQIIDNFYQKIKQNTTSVQNDSMSSSKVYINDILVTKTIDRSEILPDPVEATDDDSSDTQSDDVFDDSELAPNDSLLYKQHWQEAIIEISEFLVNFDIMCAGDSSTVICIHSAVRTEVKQWDSDISLDLQLTIEVFIYNEGVAAWNPLIEPLEDTSNGGYRPYKLHAKVYRMFDTVNESPTESVKRSLYSSNGSSSTSDKKSQGSNGRLSSQPPPPIHENRSSDNEKLAYVIICLSDDHLEITLTPSSISVIRQFIEAQTKEHHNAMSNVRSAIQDSRPPVRIDNKTGVDVHIYPGPTFKDGAIKDKYNASVLVPTHSMRHFPSIIEPFEKGRTRKRKLQTIVENKILIEGTDGNTASSDVDRGIPLFLEQNSTINEIDCDSDSESIDSTPNLPAKEFFETDLPVIEDSMYDMSANGYKDETDFGELAQRRRSVSRMRSLNSRNHERELDYWRPASLFKTHKIKLQLNDDNISQPVKISHPGVFAVPIHHSNYGWTSVVCDVSIKNTVRKVVIHSGLQIKNNLPMSVTVYSRDICSSSPEKIGELHRDQVFYIPLAILGEKKSLAFGVGISGIASNESVDWRELNKQKFVILTCPESTVDGNVFYIKASLYSQPAVNQITSQMPSDIIDLEPPLTLQNNLPIPINVTLQTLPVKHSVPLDCIELSPGDEENVMQLQLKGTILVKLELCCNELTYQGNTEVKIGGEVMTNVFLEGFDQTGKSVRKMYIGIRTDVNQLSLLHFYVPFWIINKTGLNLEYEHQYSKGRSHKYISSIDSNVPTLLSCKISKSGEHQKMKLRIVNGEWSKPFIIGAIGKSYNVSSKQKDSLYEVSVETHLLKNTLTEIVYIIPKYAVLNETEFPLTCISENNKQMPLTLLPKQLSPFWPGASEFVTVSCDTQSTRQFSLNVVSPMILAMNSESLPLITVKVQPDPIKGTSVITIHPYADTGSLLQVQNLCRRLSIKFMQAIISGSGQLYMLSPDQSILYTWDSPSDQRELKWKVIEAKETSWHSLVFEQAKQSGSVSVHIATDGHENERNGFEVVTCYWMTMFEESHLVLRFFDDETDLHRLKKLCQNKESADLQFFCSLEGIGLSLVDNTPKEVAYCTISSSPAVWMKKPYLEEIWTPIDTENSTLLETAWRTGKSHYAIGNEEFDLNTMVSNKRGHISRSFNPGIWVWYSYSSRESSSNVKLGRVQIDNQLDEIELPKRVVFSTKDEYFEVEAPFLDLLLTINLQDKNSIREIEKCYLKISPTQLNLELGLVAALLPFYDVLTAKDDSEYVELQKDDMLSIEKSLEEILKIEMLIKERTINYIDILQIAQTSMFVNYTTAGDYDLSTQWGKVVNALIHFAAITKASFDIGLNSVSISNEIVDTEQIKRLLWGHYKNEMMCQFQSLALGLDVIGSPSNLFSSFQTGTKDLITNSRQGVIEGEAGSGIARGVKSFLGHFIEGSAESGVRSTGALSSMLLAATDMEYQRKHRRTRQIVNERDLTSNLKLGSTFFIRGVIHGTTDIIVKPITGASSDGLEGFMKGIGRGTVSVLVKPTLGVVDLAKYTMEGIRSTVEDDFGLQTTRLPRLIHSDKILTPYNCHEAEGLYIMHHLSEPIYDEDYVFHEWLPSTKPTADPLVIVVTSKQMMQLRKSRKKYRIEWSTGLDTIIQTQAMHFVIEDQNDEDPGLLLVYKEEGLFRKKERTIILKLEDAIGAQVIEGKINSARKAFIKQQQSNVI